MFGKIVVTYEKRKKMLSRKQHYHGRGITDLQHEELAPITLGCERYDKSICKQIIYVSESLMSGNR